MKRSLGQIYSEFVQLRSRKEIVGQMAVQAKLSGRKESLELLCREFEAIEARLEYLSEIEVEFEDIKIDMPLDIKNCIK